MTLKTYQMNRIVLSRGICTIDARLFCLSFATSNQLKPLFEPRPTARSERKRDKRERINPLVIVIDRSVIIAAGRGRRSQGPAHNRKSRVTVQ